MQNALNKNAKYVIFVGYTEQEKGVCKLKDLDQNLEREISISKLAEVILKT